MSLLRTIVILLAALWAGASVAHEFWISPDAYETPNGGQVQAQLRVGQEFKGGGYSFNPRNFERFELIQNGVTTPVKGRLGDTPALDMTAPGDGLLVIVHETSANRLTYTDMAKFNKFATHKDFDDAVGQHRARGLPDDKFVERYHRYAKSLVKVGDGTGSDVETGMKTEIVALANPYTDALTEMPVKVLLDGAPRADVQIELFEKAPDGTVDITLHRTDADGVGSLPVKPGHEYLVDAVALLPLDEGDPAKTPVWWSVWASLTFKTPN